MIYHAFQVKMSAMNKPENSRKRKQFSIKDKIDIIDQVKNGKSRSAVTKEFSVPEATLRGWLKDEDRLRSSLSEMDNPEQKRSISSLMMLPICPKHPVRSPPTLHFPSK